MRRLPRRAVLAGVAATATVPFISRLARGQIASPTSPADIDFAIREVERAGGRLLRRGEFSPGFPFAYVSDPDGYEIEIWFE